MGVVIAIVGILVCMAGMYREGYKSGRDTGVHDGFLVALKAICDEDIKVDGRKFIFDTRRVKFVDAKTGDIASEVDMDDLEFV